MAQPRKVLIVDDEPDVDRLVRQCFRRELREGQLEFLSARNGVEALSVLQDPANASVEVALCDLNMPQMDGLTLLDHLQSGHPLLKNVIISAYNDMHNIRGAMHRGAFDFLTKPIDLQDLGNTLHRALQQALRTRETIEAIRQNNVLRMYVNDAVLRHLSHEKFVSTQRRAEPIIASVSFMDICGFTPLAEQSPPEQVLKLLDDYFDHIVSSVVKHGGVVDKFIGDAVMSVFREKDHARSAVAAAVAAREQLRVRSRCYRELFGQEPAISVGIHSGSMLACSVGAASLSRFDFTVIGDSVNTAARLQQQAGAWQILASESTQELAGLRIAYGPERRLSVKGKTSSILAFPVESLL